MKFYFVLGLSFFVAACSSNNVKKDNSLKQYFDENKVQGCFALMDNGTGAFTVYNLARYRDSAYQPGATFDIVNSLIGLQTGKIVNDSMVVKWDGVQRTDSAWNKDLNMFQAFRVSSAPYYQEVARRIGNDTMQLWMDTLKYGAKTIHDKVKINAAVDSFWMNNKLKITPDQQLGLVKRLYFDQLPFFKSYQEVVKRAMAMENNTNTRLAYKSGFGNLENDNLLGWIVGWIEENKHVYFFVLNTETPDQNADLKTIQLKMIGDILKKLNFFNGKM